MRKVFFMLFVSLVIVSLASVSLAGEYRIVREKWDQNLRDLSTGELTPTYKGEWVQSVNGIPPRAGERGRGEDGKEYVWVEAGAERRPAQPIQPIDYSRHQQTQRPAYPRPNVERRPVITNAYNLPPGGRYEQRNEMAIYVESAPKGGMQYSYPSQSRRGLAREIKQAKAKRRDVPLHSDLVRRKTAKGETYYGVGMKYTPSVSLPAILCDNGKTEAQGKNLKPGDNIKLRGSALINQIDKLYAERDLAMIKLAKMESKLAERERASEIDGQLIMAQKTRIAELDEEILRLKAENVEKDQEIARLKNPSPAPIPAGQAPTPAAPAVPANPPVQPKPGVIPVDINDLPSTPSSSIPTIGGGAENVAKNKKAADEWNEEEVLADFRQLESEKNSQLAKAKK